MGRVTPRAAPRASLEAMQRPRRLRRTPALRALTREIRLSAEQFILPLFVHEGVGDQVIGTMPGVLRHDLPGLLARVQEAQELGIGSVILFGIPDHKDPDGSQAYAGGGIVQQAITEIKARFPTLTVIADTCLCEYTDHGHCGPLMPDGAGGWTVDNDAALPLLAQTAVSQAARRGRYRRAERHDGRPGGRDSRSARRRRAWCTCR